MVQARGARGVDHGRPRRAAAGVVVLIAATTWAGCASERTETCVSWVDFPSPADAATSVELAVPAEILGATGTTELFGATATVWSVRVTGPALGGTSPGAEDAGGAVAPTVDVGDELEVASTPVTCSSREAYPDGDPMDVDVPVILFLDADDDHGGWRTATPWQGVVPTGPGGALPDAWPSR